MATSPLSVSALNFSLNSPEEVFTDREFKVSISLDSQEVHDVKIYVEDPSSSPKTISEIFNGDEWQNSYYYLDEAYPNKSSFNLKILKEGDWKICLRVRKSSTPSESLCNEISVKSLIKEEPKITEEKTNDADKNEEESSEDDAHDESKNTKKYLDNNLSASKRKSNSSAHIQEQEIIFLNSKDNSVKTITTKELKKDLTIFYSFTGACIIIIILLALRKL